jgi:DNA-binding MarR family transcriptional regulator
MFDAGKFVSHTDDMAPDDQSTDPRQLEFAIARRALPVKLATSLQLLLQRTTARLRTETDKGLEPLGITARQAAVLATLDHAGPLSQQTLGALLGVDRTTMVALIDHLEKLRAVERRRDAKDRRVYALRLTAKGTLLAQKGAHALEKAESHLLATLPRSDRDRLRKLLTLLCEWS